MLRIAGHHGHAADGDAVGALEGDVLAAAIHDVALLVVAADADQRRAEAAVRQHAPGAGVAEAALAETLLAVADEIGA